MLSLPLYTRMSDADVERVVAAVRAALARLSRDRRWPSACSTSLRRRARRCCCWRRCCWLIALWIKLDSPGPVFFRQERVGRHGVPFRIHKFRTMVADAPQRGPALTVGADPRITRVGALAAPHASSTSCRS